MNENTLLKAELVSKLSSNPALTVPRNVKLLKRYLNIWFETQESEFNPGDLFFLCCSTAGINGKNAFLRAFTGLISEADSKAMLASKFWGFIDQNSPNDSLNELAEIIAKVLPNEEQNFKMRTDK